MANLGCNLECVKKGGKVDTDEVVEFVGPVKIILVNQSKHAYCLKTWYAAFIVLAEMMIATTFLIAALYSLTYKKNGFMQGLHIFLCTVGMQLCFPMGVLNLNNLSGGAAPMKLADRKFEHGIMQVFGVGTTVVGSFVSCYSDYATVISAHSCFGFAASTVALLSGIVGIVLYIFCDILSKDEVCTFDHLLITSHHILGILTIILSSICFITGIIKDSFVEWLPLDEILYCLAIFCVLYTIIVISKPISLINSYV